VENELNENDRFRNPPEEVFPNSYPIKERDLEDFRKKKGGNVTVMTDPAPYRKRIEDITSENLEKY
jgi:hypothetical protein